MRFLCWTRPSSAKSCYACLQRRTAAEPWFPAQKGCLSRWMPFLRSVYRSCRVGGVSGAGAHSRCCRRGQSARVERDYGKLELSQCNHPPGMRVFLDQNKPAKLDNTISPADIAEQSRAEHDKIASLIKADDCSALRSCVAHLLDCTRSYTRRLARHGARPGGCCGNLGSELQEPPDSHRCGASALPATGTTNRRLLLLG
jgi:hypothetical protein